MIKNSKNHHTIPISVAKAFDREAASLAQLGVSEEKIKNFYNEVFDYSSKHGARATVQWMKLESSFLVSQERANTNFMKLIDDGSKKIITIDSKDHRVVLSLIKDGHCIGCQDNGDGTETLSFERSARLISEQELEDECDAWMEKQISVHGENIFDRF